MSQRLIDKQARKHKKKMEKNRQTQQNTKLTGELSVLHLLVR